MTDEILIRFVLFLIGVSAGFKLMWLLDLLMQKR